MTRFTAAVFATLLLTTQARGSTQGGAPPPGLGDLPPAGFGQLNQDDISLELAAGDIDVRMVPLDERVIRLVAKDGYTSLHALVASKQPAIDSITRRYGVDEPGLALVTFFARMQDAHYDPQDLTISVRNRLVRPIGIVPISANFAGRQLSVRQQTMGLYVFDGPVPVADPFTLTYGTYSTDGWQGILQQLQREREKVEGRARRAGVDTILRKGPTQ
jgi:hypothetical protein